MIFFPLRPFYTYSNQLSCRLFCQNVNTRMNRLLKPPEHVYLMTNLNRSAFDKIIQVPMLRIGVVKVSSVLPIVKKFFLKMENFKPIYSRDEEGICIYLNPEVLQKWSDLPQDVRKHLEELCISETHFKMEDFTLKYENFNAETILRSVLPKDKEGVSSFTKVGHIVHVNLREHLIPFKSIIGEILFDKVKGCESVVNKVNMIENTYRNFKMEILKGENKMQTLVKENNCKFEFDFSTVYWNSRLCTEHERIIKLLKPDDVLFDVFAGVGPFSIPAAKKRCIVFANDLNPESFKWLMHNKKLNKISDEYFKGFNLDGRDFILTVIKENLPRYAANHNIVIVMNLPALAPEFLDAYVGLLKNTDICDELKPIIVYMYCFAKGENPEEIARNLVHNNLKVKNVDIDNKITNIFRVRTVSSMKEMVRVTLNLDRDILVGVADNKRKIDHEIGAEASLKKICSHEHENNGKEQKQEENQQCFQGSRSQEFQDEIQTKGSKN